MFRRRTPLAWHNLTYERRRLLTAIAGVGFAVVLMFMFRGFENALYDSQVQLLKLLNGDIIVVSRIKTNMFVPVQFARRRLYQAEAFAGVTAAYPLYTTTANWKNPVSKRTRPLRVLAFNPSDDVLPLSGVEQHRSDLRMPWTALLDEKSRAEVGPKQAGVVTELSEKRVTVVGTFSLGTDFASGNGNVVMSDQNFLRYFSNLSPDKESRSLNTVDIGLLRIANGTNVEGLVKVLRDRLPKDVSIFSKQEFVDQELNYWRKNTSIGFVFSLLTTMSFLVGVILVYQILYTDVADHWVEYATLKAIGYSNRYLFGIVLQQGALLGFLGFVPGCLISFGLYTITRNATGLYIVMTPSRIINLMIATFLMCLISGVIAIRRVQQADPAEVFGS